ncbi:MAG: NUDIX hydrolase [Promethearchaeota archaeon]
MECNHKWQNKRDDFYLNRKKFSADILTCLNCGKIKIENIINHPFSTVLQPKVGVFAGIFDKMGRILLVKIDYGEHIGEWNLPGGGVEAEYSANAIDEQFLLLELAREVEEETGLKIPLNFNKYSVEWPTLIKGGYDLAIPILIGMINDRPSKGETMFASLNKVQILANESRNKRILKGHGERMHRMILRLLCHSPNRSYQTESQKILKSFYTNISNITYL